MPRFTMDDLHSLERPQTSPHMLRTKVGDVIVNSTNCRAKIEAINPDTGEYRLVLQGTLDKEHTRFGEE